MTPFFRFEVDLDALTDAMWAFVTDPRPSRNELPVVQALHDVHPESVEVLEAMLLDGTEERGDVAAYVMTVFGGLGTRGAEDQSAGSASLRRSERTCETPAPPMLTP
jgi:hypothetical protein